MKIELPQIIYLALTFMGLGIGLNNHGKPKKGNENVWYGIISTVITLTLLYFGGFFTSN